MKIQESALPRIRLSRFYKLINMSINRTYEYHGVDITSEQDFILRSLREHGSMNQTRLAFHTGQDRNNLSKTLAILERKGYVSKIVNPEDNRYCDVSITQKGEEMHERSLDYLEIWRSNFFPASPGKMR